MNMFNRLQNFSVVDCKFPLIKFHNFLTDTESNKIVETLSNQSNFDNNVMGGRNVIYKNSNIFGRLEKIDIFNDINLFLNQKKTFNFFLKKLIDIKKNGYNFNPSNLSNKFKEKKTTGIVKILDKILNKISDGYIYLEMDYSNAQSGYYREPHHDKKERILNFLLYFNTLNEEDGGALEIYKYKNNQNQFLQRPDINNLILERKIYPKANELLVFMSNPISIHGVEKFVSNSKNRIFSYGSYTLSKRVDWVKI